MYSCWSSSVVFQASEDEQAIVLEQYGNIINLTDCLLYKKSRIQDCLPATDTSLNTPISSCSLTYPYLTARYLPLPLNPLCNIFMTYTYPASTSQALNKTAYPTYPSKPKPEIKSRSRWYSRFSWQSWSSWPTYFHCIWDNPKTCWFYYI